MAKKSKIAKNEQVVPAATSASSVSPVSVSARWLTAVSSRAFVSPAGKGFHNEAHQHQEGAD